MTECVCVTSSLYTPTYGAGGREKTSEKSSVVESLGGLHNAKLASSDYNDHFGSSCDAISDGAYNIKVTIYGFDAFVSPIYARTFPKLSKISYRVRNLEPTSIERPSYDSCVAESSKHGMYMEKGVITSSMLHLPTVSIGAVSNKRPNQTYLHASHRREASRSSSYTAA
ncbi:hypothetical protein M747DRAFT_309239 [Aspergillus niger ATCC 13496]|uniref:Uncharacterized protein n=1 Tax=Aspergillus niger ATCC 13496 TaxID=1353008 RepID=A0A370BL36_ASPNG|nr:hypothetical protein M747DRAFT_309239 [Aspergillus niger ATCC 13496]